MIDDVQAFLNAWNVASKREAKERPDAAILLALNKLAEGIVSRVAHGSTVEVALKPFQKAVASKDVGESSPATLAAWTFQDGDRYLVNVSMGFASSVQAFGRAGRLSMPSALAWSYRYHGPFRRVGCLIFLDGDSIQDAGVRYGYRLAFIRRTPQGYVSAGTANGTWTYGDEAEAHLRIAGNRLTVKSLDAPRAFFVSNAERILRRVETWDASGPVARRVAIKLEDPDLRAVDEWLFAHGGTSLEGKKIPKEPSMAESLERGKGWVKLTLDGDSNSLKLRFDLALSGMKNVVRKVTVDR